MARRADTKFPSEFNETKKTNAEPLNVKQMISKLSTCVEWSKGKNGEDHVINDVLKDESVIEQMLTAATALFKREKACLVVEPPVYCVGDIHGQFTDLLRIFDKNGWPCKTNYLFLGDYVDRGPNSTEVICLLLLLKIQHPHSVHLLRGNHECSAVNRVYGFYDELEAKFENPQTGQSLWFSFQDAFNWLPLSAIVGGRLLCMHGGISPQLRTLKCLQDLPRPIDPFDPGLATDLLWSDPDPNMPNANTDPDYGPSARGISYHFSRKCVLEFCRKMDIDLIVRGHQVVQDGYEFFASRHLVTVFSAPNYCGTFGNYGAVLFVGKDFQCKVVKFAPDRRAPMQKSKSKKEVVIDDLDALMEETDDQAKPDKQKCSIEELPVTVGAQAENEKSFRDSLPAAHLVESSETMPANLYELHDQMVNRVQERAKKTQSPQSSKRMSTRERDDSTADTEFSVRSIRQETQTTNSMHESASAETVGKKTDADKEKDKANQKENKSPEVKKDVKNNSTSEEYDYEKKPTKTTTSAQNKK